MERHTASNPIAGERIVAYVLAPPARAGRADAIWRFAASVSTLRAHNPDVPVVLFVFGDVPAGLDSLCAEHDVRMRVLEPLRTRVAALSPVGWPVFVGAPLLARLLVFAELAELAPAQVLLCDEHTVVYGDLAELFDTYRGPDLVAREQLHCDRSAHGVDRRLLDEPLLARLAVQQGLAVVPPFDPGVVLLNNGLWCRFAHLQRPLVDYAWRLAVGATLRPARPSTRSTAWTELRPTPAAGIDLTATRATDDDVVRALPFPSADQRLLVAVAWWLTLGHVDGLTTGDFAEWDVAIGDELAGPIGDHCVIGHHAGDGHACLSAWLHERTVALAS